MAVNNFFVAVMNILKINLNMIIFKQIKLWPRVPKSKGALSLSTMGFQPLSSKNPKFEFVFKFYILLKFHEILRNSK